MSCSLAVFDASSPWYIRRGVTNVNRWGVPNVNGNFTADMMKKLVLHRNKDYNPANVLYALFPDYGCNS